MGPYYISLSIGLIQSRDCPIGIKVVQASIDYGEFFMSAVN